MFTLLRYVFSFCVSDYMPFLRGLALDGHEKKVKDAMSIVAKYNDPIIERRIEKWKDGLKTNAEDILDIVISLKDANKQTIIDIRGNQTANFSNNSLHYCFILYALLLFLAR